MLCHLQSNERQRPNIPHEDAVNIGLCSDGRVLALTPTVRLVVLYPRGRPDIVHGRMGRPESQRGQLQCDHIWIRLSTARLDHPIHKP